MKFLIVKIPEQKIERKVDKFADELAELMVRYLTVEGCKVIDLLPVLTLMEARAKAQILEDVDDMDDLTDLGKLLPPDIGLN